MASQDEEESLTEAVLKARKEAGDHALTKKAGELEKSAEDDERVVEPDNKSDEPA